MTLHSPRDKDAFLVSRASIERLTFLTLSESRCHLPFCRIIKKIFSFRLRLQGKPQLRSFYYNKNHMTA